MSATMKALRLYAPNDLRLEELPIPEIGEGEILVRIRAALICGTDVRMYRSGAKKVPLTPGHEIAGIIAAVGPGIESTGAPCYREGLRVAVAPNFGCGVCDACVAGDTHLCNSLSALGVTIDGGFAEYLRVPAAAVRQGNVAPIADSVSFAAAAMAEPLSCVYNSFERSHLRPGESVLVIGAGPIGLMHAQVYRMAGAGLVMIHDTNLDRLATCATQDASFVTLGPEDVRDRVFELTRGKGADVVITAASVPAVQQMAFPLAAMNGRVIFFGGLPAGKEMVALDTNIIHYRMITVTGTSRQNLRQYRQCLALIGQGAIPVDSILTGAFPISEYAQAFDAALRGEGLKSGFLFD